MKHLLMTTALIGASLGTSASAQSVLPEGFDINGNVSLTYTGTTGGGNGEFYASSDVDVSWTSGTFGIDVSMIGFATEDNSVSGFFGALTYTFGDGQKFSIGAPRPAFDKFGRFRNEDYFEFFGGFGGTGGGTSLLTFYTIAETGSPYTILGLRYDGRFGGVDAAASYHASPDGAGFLISSSAAYQSGNGTVAGGIEYLDVDDILVSTLKLRYDTQVGQYDLGAGLASTRIEPSSGPGSLTTTLIELAGDYSFTDNISAGALLMNIRQSSGGMSIDESLYGVRGRYNFNNGASANASLLKYDGDDDMQYSVGVRYDF